MNRRNAIKIIGTGTAVAAIAPGTLLQAGCDSPGAQFAIDTVIGDLKALLPLLPGAKALLEKGIAIASDLNSAFKTGKFANVAALFANLTDVIQQIATDVGASSPKIQIVLALAGVALMTIAAFVKEKADAAPVVLAQAMRSASQEQLRGAAMIQRATDPAAVSAIVSALQKMENK